MAGFVPSNKLSIITILSVGFIFPMGCLLSDFVSSAIVATPFRRCEFTKSNVFLISCTLLVIFLSLSSSLLHNCSCMAFCNSLNLSSSMPSSSGSSGRPLNMNSNIPISFMPILSFAPFLLPFLYLLRYWLLDHLVVCPVCLFQHLRPQFPFCGTFNLDILCCLFIWGFTFFGPLLTLIFGIFACT